MSSHTHPALDERGLELPSLEEAKRRAVEAAYAVAAEQLQQGKLDLDTAIAIKGESGTILHTVHLRDLIRPEGLPS